MVSNLCGISMLVIEDELLIALDIQNEFEALGATILGPYSTLNAAIDAAHTQTPTIGVLDTELHGQAVFPAAKILQSRGIPFFFYTGRTERHEFNTEFSGVKVLGKPASRYDFLEAIDETLLRKS